MSTSTKNSLLARASNYCTFFKKRKEEEDEKDMLATPRRGIIHQQDRYTLYVAFG